TASYSSHHDRMKRSPFALTSQSSPFLQACFREPTSYTPVCFMRQAGRSLPEFRAIRERHDFMEICRHPELCAEVSLQRVHRLGVDAAILFADIMTPLIGIGLEIDLVEHKGPVIQKPVRGVGDLDRLRSLRPEEDLWYMSRTIRLVKTELGEH